MAASQRNFQYFTYIDDNGTSWNKRGNNDPWCAGIDGHAAFTATTGTPIWDKNTRKFHSRSVKFQDPTTFRTVSCTVYTAAAFAAITGATTIAVEIPGEATAVTYELSEKIGEKQPVAKTSRQLIDHA
jgi:hypothetical protein